MSYRIDKNVPLPRKPNKYPCADLEVGDSFLIPNKDIISGPATRGAIYGAARRLGIKLSVRKTSKGVRVWRVE